MKLLLQILNIIVDIVGTNVYIHNQILLQPKNLLKLHKI